MKTITKDDVRIVKDRLNLNPKSKILNISHHGCMDGTTSTIPIYNCFDNVHYIKAKPIHKSKGVSEIARNIDYDAYDAVIFTDIAPNDKSVLSTPKNVILIDHHDTALENHDPDNMRFVYMGESASLLTKKFCGHYFNKDMSYMDALTNHVNNYDMWIDPHGKNWHMNLLHHKCQVDDNWTYKSFVKRFCTGDVEFNEKEMKYLLTQEANLEKAWQRVKGGDNFALPNNINGCLIMENEFVNELCHKFIDEDGCKIAFNKNPKSFQCSVRTNLPNVKIGQILSKLVNGGGHDDSGGFVDENVVDFRHSLERICKYLYDNFEEIRL